MSIKRKLFNYVKLNNHPNIIQTYNYYFYETQVNTYRLAIVCELMDESLNLERIFRRRQQKAHFWKEEDLEKLIVSLISTMSFLQSIGICHRDIKPSNLFITKNGEIKVIDFGESKDYFADGDDGGEGTMATIRGTPQYLSPILWKAYVVDKNTRHATHNIYKSDVFSSGLVFFQIASLEDVTGFNNIEEGESIIEKNLAKLRKRYSEHIWEILRLMLKFEESERPSFIELAKLVLTSEDNTLQSPKDERKVDEDVIEERKNQSYVASSIGVNKKESVDLPSQNTPQLNSELGSIPHEHQSSSQYMTQADLFKNYVEANKLYVNFGSDMYWFEAGGDRIGKVELNLDPEAEEAIKWKLMGTYKNEFYSHVVVVPTNEQATFYVLGGIKNNCLLFKDKNFIIKANMPEKSFFSAVYLNGKVYTFGGFDIYDKVQLKTWEYYDIEHNKWDANSSVALSKGRSQSSSCIFDDDTIYIFGGYNKEGGTLGSIEKYEISKSKILTLKVTMPTPLRRFSTIKISTTKILLIGGLEKINRESDAVYCLDLEPEYRIEKLDKIDKAGVVDYPIIIDNVGNLHLFVEKDSGTSPPTDVIYSFLEYS